MGQGTSALDSETDMHHETEVRDRKGRTIITWDREADWPAIRAMASVMGWKPGWTVAGPVQLKAEREAAARAALVASMSPAQREQWEADRAATGAEMAARTRVSYRDPHFVGHTHTDRMSADASRITPAI